MINEWINTAQIKRDNSVGYIFISGMIEPNNHDFFCEKYTAICDIVEALDRFEKDPVLETIALIINSPGGNVAGVSNLCNKISSIKKPVISYVNNNCLSAAYWIASATSKIIATSKNAFFGSIGVLASIKVNNDFITIANSQSPLKDVDMNTEEGKLEIQKQLDAVFNVFVESVATSRNKTIEYVKENFGKGAAVSASEALAVGLIDEINESEEILPTSIAVAACARDMKYVAKQTYTHKANSFNNKRVFENIKNRRAQKMEDNKETLTAEDVKELLTAVISPLVEKLQSLEDDISALKASANYSVDDENNDDEDEKIEARKALAEKSEDDEYPDGTPSEPEKYNTSITGRNRLRDRQAFRDMSGRNASSNVRPYDKTKDVGGEYANLMGKAFTAKGLKIEIRS